MSEKQRTAERLAPYDANGSKLWTFRDAAHLLGRAQFGASYDEISQAAADGLDATLDRLLTIRAETHEFTTVEPMLRRAAYDTANIADLKAWWVYRMLYSANPLVEKMSLFWHNHFATSNAKVKSVPHMAAQNDLIRRHAIGSFRNLLGGMARDVAMLIWLDGNANRKRHPNENFAREVMELFSLGVGNYTETDIKQAARAFTGWHVRDEKFWFDRSQHDYGPKTVLGRKGDLDGGEVIEICLAQPACPRFLATKLLRQFVVPHPEPALVEQLAARIRLHDYAMDRVLRDLFSSRVFFDESTRHAIIKSPADLVVGSLRALGAQADLSAVVQTLSELGQDLFEPPTVKGWDGGRLWINSGLVLKRANFAAELTQSNRFGPIEDPGLVVQRLKLDSPEQLAQFYAELLLARQIEPTVKTRLVDYLRQATGERGQRARGLIHLIMTMPEYQLG